MKLKSLITLLYILISGSIVVAQNKKEVSESKLNLDFGTATGVFTSFDKTGDNNTHVGSTAITSLQLNYVQKYFLKLQFGQTTAGFKSNNDFGLINSNIDSKANITNLGLGIGYQERFGNWQPFIFAGAGASFIDVPEATFDSNTNTLHLTTTSDTKPNIYAGGGVNFILSETLTIFWEGQLSTLPKKPKTSDTHLSGFSTMIGIKRNF